MTDKDISSNPNPIFIHSDITALRERFLEWADKELEKPVSDERREEINILNETFDVAFDEFLDIALAADRSGRLRSLIFRMMICSAAYSKLAPPNQNITVSVLQAHSENMNNAKKNKSKEAYNLLDEFLKSMRGDWEDLDIIPTSLANLYSVSFRKKYAEKINRCGKDNGFPGNDTWPSSSTVRRSIIRLKKEV